MIYRDPCAPEMHRTDEYLRGTRSATKTISLTLIARSYVICFVSLHVFGTVPLKRYDLAEHHIDLLQTTRPVAQDPHRAGTKYYE